MVDVYVIWLDSLPSFSVCMTHTRNLPLSLAPCPFLCTIGLYRRRHHSYGLFSLSAISFWMCRISIEIVKSCIHWWQLIRWFAKRYILDKTQCKIESINMKIVSFGTNFSVTSTAMCVCILLTSRVLICVFVSVSHCFFLSFFHFPFHSCSLLNLQCFLLCSILFMYVCTCLFI